VRTGGAPEVDSVMAAIVGAAGLPACMAAARAGKRLLLANKEALVVGGALFMQAVPQGGATLLPIDSEHSAIFQCLPEDRRPGRSASTTSCSPPRRPLPRARPGHAARVTPEQAGGPPELGDGPQDLGRLGHDDEQGARGDRGALAVRPAPERIKVVIHPQSIIHSMVVCRDASVLAQLGTPDMKVPIAYGLSFPQRIESGRRAAGLPASCKALSFEPRAARFPGLFLAWDACAHPRARTAVLNAANEWPWRPSWRNHSLHRDSQCQCPHLDRLQPGSGPPLAGRPARTRPPGARRAARAGHAGAGRVITTVLAFLLTLGVLIVVHEYGHYRVAVACGVKVLRFLGRLRPCALAPPATPDDTEFVVCALPLGGYVRMLDEREGPVDAELGQAFNRQPLWRRAAIVAAGPLANLLLAVLLYAGAHWIGWTSPRP
jgi:hypothetical protein